ncbi:MAG: hypothetical protein JO022_02535, partial [Acidobacteriaceae bacterium]|nr:hypothetical protein [Acidobacteriaceae bacterium]
LGFGWVAKAMGFNAAFIGLGIAAASGGALYLLKMPETCESKREHKPGEQPQQDQAA